MLNFLHAADLHLDSMFDGIDTRQVVSRRRESRGLVFRMADYVNEHQIPLVLMAGDLFDTAAPYRETGELLARALDRMNAHVFITPGNRDWYAPGSPWKTVRWPDNVTVFTENVLTPVEIPAWNLVVYGAAFTGPEQPESMLKNFTLPEGTARTIGLMHGELCQGQGRYNPIAPAEAAVCGLNYLALGHVHQRGEPRRFGRTVCAWPGCMEGRGFDEPGDRGFYHGTLSDSGIVSLHFVPFAGRRYESITVDVTGRNPKEALETALPDDTVRDLYRISLTGETSEKGIDLETLRETFAHRFYALELLDHTRLEEDLWASRDESSLRGLFLKELYRQFQSAKTEQQRQIITQAARMGLAALEGRDPV